MDETINLSFSTFQEWLSHEYTHNELADICNHGAQSGFHGLIYYSETTRLYDRYHENIWDLLNDDRFDIGCSSCLEFIASFNGVSGVNSDEQFKNLLVWYAAEKSAFDLTQGEYTDEKDNDN